MRILIVSQYFWPESFCINDVAMSLRGRGHAVEVLTGYPNYPSGAIFEGYGLFRKRGRNHCGIAIKRVPIYARRSGRFLPLILNYLSFVLSSCLLGPLLCRKRYDVIFVYEPSPISVALPALLLKKLKGIPVVFWVQDLWPESLAATGAVRSERILRLVGRLVRFIYRRCDRVLVQSEVFRLPAERMGADARAIDYYPNCVDAIYQPLRLESDAPERAEMPEGFRVMFAGNVGVAQDFGTVLDAAERLREHQEIKWVVIGDGRQFAWVEEEIRSRRLSQHVILLGRRPSEAMPRYLAMADVALVTLRKDPIFSLTVPSKLQAYMACGKPILAALDGEGARIVKAAGAGLTCPAESPELLAERVLELYRMGESERRAMGERGRTYFRRNFEKELLLDRLECVFADVLSTRASSMVRSIGDAGAVRAGGFPEGELK